MAELPVIRAAANFVMEIRMLPTRAAIITFLDPEAIFINLFARCWTLILGVKRSSSLISSVIINTSLSFHGRKNSSTGDA
jgi:hypothetical protein